MALRYWPLVGCRTNRVAVEVCTVVLEVKGGAITETIYIRTRGAAASPLTKGLYGRVGEGARAEERTRIPHVTFNWFRLQEGTGKSSFTPVSLTTVIGVGLTVTTFSLFTRLRRNGQPDFCDLFPI